MDQHSREMYETVCKERFDSIEEQAKSYYLNIEKKLDSLTSTLLGNGKEGVTTQIAVIREKVDDHISNDTRRWKFLAGTAAALFVAVLGKLIYDIISHIS